MNRRNLLLCIGSLALVTTPPAKGAGPAILTLRGDFAKANPDGSLSLSLADLDAMPQTRFTTRTPWHSGAVEFSGVSLADFLTAMGASGPKRKLQLIALNDYVADAETSELIAGDALLATRLDGVPMSTRDKGPVFMVFPFDSRGELQHQSYYSRAVWQLAEIDLVP